jgi:2,4-dienoyl-CoA reductase-like NADH-dependent reductase (Old Yellow Enzyme family)
MSTQLFTPIELRGLKIKNRIFMSPMCQYSSIDGVAQSWHMAHLGSRAVGGVGLVTVEATGVSPEGRISPGDMGLWNEDQMKALAPIVQLIKSQGAAAAIQLAHAGRKASTDLPWVTGGPLPVDQGGWSPILAPSAVPFDKGYQTPQALDSAGLKKVLADFVSAAGRAQQAGFDVVEIHCAHGYLLHSFLSPLSNTRTDEFGGSLENRMRFPLQVAEAVRKAWPQTLPVFVRISATDWAQGGWDLEQSVHFCKKLKTLGIDLIDVSTGGLVPHVKIPVGPGYQVPCSEEIRKLVQMPTGAVGMITEAHQANDILAQGKADVVFLARELLRSPYWARAAAKALGVEVHGPVQYGRA